MQNVTKFLEISAYLLMFCTAVTLFLFSERSLDRLIVTMKNEISKENILYENERIYDEIKGSKTTYAELITMLLGDLDYDIRINNMTILKEGFNYQMFDFSAIPQADFSKSYQYDSDGNIVKVIFTS